MSQAPFTHGLEVEQHPNQVSRRVENEVFRQDHWHRDASGPQEHAYGPYKNVKSLYNAFRRDCNGHTWDWHNSSGENGSGSGCGSHVHLHVTDKFDDVMEAWTVSYNTVVELALFFAPFWCADWEHGFRNSASRWCSPETTRFSQSTVEGLVNGRAHRDNGKAVTFNSSTREKPITLEVRMNENHPAFATVGLLFLRRITNRCVEKGWSPKLAGNRDGTLRDVYEEIYNLGSSRSLIDAMKDTGEIEFQEGRGIPGAGEHFDHAWDLFTSILAQCGTDSGNYKDRIKAFTRDADEHGMGPQDLGDDLWAIDEPTDFWLAVDDRNWGEAELLLPANIALS